MKEKRIAKQLIALQVSGSQTVGCDPKMGRKITFDGLQGHRKKSYAFNISFT